MAFMNKCCDEDYHIGNSNFREKYLEIENDIKRAVFISIDAEYSGLTFSSKFKNSLFDSGEQRYKTLKKSIENFIIIQLGLTTFHFNIDNNKYDAHMYNFFLFPRAVGSVDKRFFCQASSLEFLSKSCFDFNKFIYDGIPFLNIEQENIIKMELLDKQLFKQVERTIPLHDEQVLQDCVSRISEWYLTDKKTDMFVLEDKALGKNEILVYLIQKEVLDRYNDLWTEFSLNQCSQILVRRVSIDERNRLLLGSGDSLEKNVVEYFVGFSKIIKLIESLKKPIVGHNLLLDLMIIYNQFYQPLPEYYKTFKKDIHAMFPKIFDTKLISYELKKVLRKEVAWNSNAVLDLYRYFDEGPGRKLTVYEPEVKLWTKNIEQTTPNILLHEAGWDSYISGYCFIQMGHYFASNNFGSPSYERPLTSSEHINSVNKFMNKVNVVRASIAYVNFEGDDPLTNRPKTLLVKTINSTDINVIEVTEILAKYCSIDIKALNSRSALVAVSNFNSARQILKDFKKHDKYKISMYHPIKDSEIVKVALWSGLVISGGVCVAALILKIFGKH